MNVAITGANGFLGRAVVTAAREAGHPVIALLREGRRAADFPWLQQAGVTVRFCDLVQPSALEDALAGSDAVIHVAAALAGDEQTQYRGTVVATRHLCETMQHLGIRRLVGISSFSVYDGAAQGSPATLDEQFLLETAPQARDSYARSKLEQDRLFRSFGAIPGQTCVTLRPGILYDTDRRWSFALGQALGARRWLAMGPDSPVPMVHVDDVAAAAVLALQAKTTASDVLNLVESPAPMRAVMLRALSRQSGAPACIRLPWGLHLTLARLAGTINALFGQRLPLPGLLRAVRLHARFPACGYSNAQAQVRLGWKPRHDFLREIAP